MKLFFFLLFFSISVTLRAQSEVQTIVPLQPVTVGTAFQVQYIVAGEADVIELQSPAFGRDFRFVSGPRLYEGQALINNTKTPIRNFSYTLIPLRKGRLVVKGATVVYKDGKRKSKDVFVVVTDEPKDDPLAATPVTGLPRLAPGAGLEKKLQEQLFIEAAVSKPSCTVGEPIVATFTLFSRLPSASEVIKNPGFYGFSVLDMPDAVEGQQTVQTHNGTFYNTHILRKVQLYPMQAGLLQIDKMSVSNSVEYLDSLSGIPLQAQVVMESKPLQIAVKPLPATPQHTSGAVGRFALTAHLEKITWPQNSTGTLLVTLTGNGNFLQISAPEIRWPQGIEVFEPAVTERLQKEAVPVAGTRTYTYTFTADSTGEYTIDPIAFTYFNAAEKRHKTLRTDTLHFTVLDASSNTATASTKSRKGSSRLPALFWIAGALGLFAGLLLVAKRKQRKKQTPAALQPAETPDFEKDIRFIDGTDVMAYRQLQLALMGFLKSRFPQPELWGKTAAQHLAALPLAEKDKETLQVILEECQLVQYYNVTPTRLFPELQLQALAFIQSVKRSA
jgi:hypothetical protein